MNVSSVYSVKCYFPAATTESTFIFVLPSPPDGFGPAAQSKDACSWLLWFGASSARPDSVNLRTHAKAVIFRYNMWKLVVRDLQPVCGIVAKIYGIVVCVGKYSTFCSVGCTQSNTQHIWQKRRISIRLDLTDLPIFTYSCLRVDNRSCLHYSVDETQE